MSITFTLVMAQRHDLANGRRGERLEGARHGGFAIEHVGNQDLRRELFFTELLTELEGLDVVKEFDHFLVGAIAEGAEKSGREEFPAALAAIEINVKQIARIELHFDPGAAIRNDAETVKHLAVEMDARFEGDPRRTMQLADDDALRAVDHERPLRRHERDFAHVNFLFLGPLFLAELESDVERRAVGLAFPLRLERGQFRLADLVMAEIERRLFIVALDRKHFLENGLQPRHFPLRERHILLEEVEVGIELNLDEVWRLDAFLNGSEVDTFRHKLLHQSPRL